MLPRTGTYCGEVIDTVQNTQKATSDSDNELSYRRIAVFFLPLLLSGLMMSAGQPIVQAGLARLKDPEVTLAAYGMAFYTAVLLESPIIMLLPAANALVTDQKAYRLTRNCMLAISLALTVATALITFITPVYNYLFEIILGYPEAVASAARPGLAVLLLWPALIGIRRYYQGILVKFGWTSVVGWGTGVRLVSMVLVVVLGSLHFPDYGVVVGSAALVIGVLVDAVVALIASRILLVSEGLAAVSADTPEGARSVAGFIGFFAPLALTSVLRTAAQPLMLSGIARAYQPVLSLAAFPVAMGTAAILANHLRMLREVFLTLVQDEDSLDKMKKFSSAVAVGFTVIMGTVAFTPLANLYHGSIIGLTGETLLAANISLQFLAVMPLLRAFQAYYQGLLIGTEKTWPVNGASLVNLIILVVCVNAAAAATGVSGYLIGGVVLPAALLGEVMALRYWSRPCRREIVASGQRRKRANADAV